MIGARQDDTIPDGQRVLNYLQNTSHLPVRLRQQPGPQDIDEMAFTVNANRTWNGGMLLKARSTRGQAAGGYNFAGAGTGQRLARFLGIINHHGKRPEEGFFTTRQLPEGA